jgi:hypothetical protein
MPTAPAQDGWAQRGPYEYVHPDGWTIVNCIISGRSVWRLRHGDADQGTFSSAAAAMVRHAELLLGTGY